jgi:hypothetical protein
MHSQYKDPEWRNIFPLPQSEDFFNLLQDRLSACVENILFQGDTRFTMFINAVDRKEYKRYERNESPEFIYAGTEKQRELLRKNAKERWGKNHSILESVLDSTWADLKKNSIEVEDSVVSSSFYPKIMLSGYNLRDTCTIYSLKKYFQAEELTKEQQLEKAIIEKYFDINEDIFISVPLIGFGEIDGIVHIVFKKNLLKLHKVETKKDTKTGIVVSQNLPKSLLWTLIRAFTAEYDGLFLDWDQVGENLEKSSAIADFVKSTILKNDEYLGIHFKDGRPDIFRELKLLDYYRHHTEYFRKRFDMGDNVPGKIYQQYITNAVTAILIDSYAHNVSAHALSTLAWWFYRQADLLRDEELDWEALFFHLKQDTLISGEVVDTFKKEIIERSKKRIAANNNLDKDGQKRQIKQMEQDAQKIRPEDGLYVVRYPGSLARELSHLLRFLTEKGAFWSGVTRDVNIGGKVSSLYSMLWYDFVNNPFYLGAIAKTEDITHIKLRIVLYEPVNHNDRKHTSDAHVKHYKPEDNGIFAEVNLADPRRTLHTADGQTPHEKTLSVFVKKGDQFSYLRDRLKEVKIFFPGGVVGRHAFYTMIENEIRNVKHYQRKDLLEMQKEGLTIAIGIQPWSLYGSQGEELYRISVWLDKPTRLVSDGGEYLLKRKWETLDGEIFNPKTYAPYLGGTYQDKVCAAFLLNGRFSQVQSGDRNIERDHRKDTPLHRRYYPWIRPACSPTEDKDAPNTHTEYKISYNNPLKEEKEKAEYSEEEKLVELPDVDYTAMPSYGYLKKVFYVWKGQYLLEWYPDYAAGKTGTEAAQDNAARYYIAHLKNNAPLAHYDERGRQETPLHTLRRRDGVVRIAMGEIPGSTDEEKYREAYKQWLYTLTGKQPYSAKVITMDGGQIDYTLLLKEENGRLKFLKQSVEEGFDYDTTVGTLITTEDIHLRQKTYIPIAHREHDATSVADLCIRYRNHGVYKSQFFPNNAPKHSIDDPQMMELFEVLSTKVCIFDNRVHHRLRLDKDQSSGYHAFLRDKLQLAAFKESISADNGEVKDENWLAPLSDNDKNFLKECHFLVMHLSFIESILPTQIPDIKDKDRSNVGLFLERYIMPLVEQRDNFFFVVTTGRGRNEWWTSLDQDEYRAYSEFTIFRAIESLLSGIENSVSMKDDVELKFRIIKNLYGS